MTRDDLNTLALMAATVRAHWGIHATPEVIARVVLQDYQAVLEATDTTRPAAA